MKKRHIYIISILVALSTLSAYSQDTISPKKYAKIETDREDGRYLSTRGVVHGMLKNNTPKHAFNPEFSSLEFKSWKKDLREAIADIMNHPELKDLPEPKLINTEQKDGYRVEKWESYPLPEAVVPFLVLIPDEISANSPQPAIMCIPGSGGSKEAIAGQPPLNPKFDGRGSRERWVMALPYVEKGLIAVVVDNPAAGEQSDLEGLTKLGRRYEYNPVARILLELGWSYLGYSSYIDMHILNWMKKQEIINKDRILISGFSLGTEPLMVMGALDESIYGFIFNDFLCNTLERMIVMTEPNKDGIRPTPNSIRHLIPRFLCNFDFPDIVASFAPRPIIFTEGGLDRDLNMVKKAYEISGKPENVEVHFYPRFADPKNRIDFKELPEGVDKKSYFVLVNVDDPMHSIKTNLTIPWLVDLLDLDNR